MPDYGWAYVNLGALSTISGGATGSVTFRSNESAVSGTSAFIYATASNKVGLGINTPGKDVVNTLPSYILDISASNGDFTAVRMHGDLQVTGSAHISGTLTVNSLHANTVISSSNLVVRDPIIGMGFGKGGAETGSVGDRGLVLGLAGNNNQAFLWDQTSGSFVLGKVGSAGADQSVYDIPNGDLSTLRLGDLTASNSVSASVFYGNGEHLSGIAAGAVTSYTNASNNRIISSVNSSTINAEENLTFDGSTLKVVGATSGSGTFHSVGAATFGSSIAATGSISGSTGQFGNITLNGVTASTISGSGVLQTAGATVLGGTLNVTGATIFASTIKAANLGTDTDNTVVIVNSSGFLKTDEIDSRVFGSTLVDGNGSSGQLTLWNDSDTVQGSSALTYDGSTLKIDDAISGSGAIHAVGAATFGTTLAVTGSTTLQETTVAGDLLVAQKIIHNGDTDTFLKLETDKVEFTVGNEILLTLTEDTQDIVTVGDGGDVDFQVKTSAEDHTIFVQGSSDLIGIRNSSPTAVLHMSQSGGSSACVEPLLRIDHPGDVSGKPTNESLFYVTGANPDDYFEAHVGINTSTPEGALHVKSKEGTNSLVVRDGKVVIGHNSAAAKFQIRQGIGGASDRDVFLAEALLSNDQVTNLFYITGSATGTGFFGSMNTGSHLAVSGTSFLTDVTASVGFSGSIGNFQTLNIGSVAVVGGTVNNTTIGGTTPAPVNQTAGTVQYRSKNANYTVAADDYIIGVAPTGSFVLGLQAASSAGTGRLLIVKDVGGTAGTNNITIEPNGSEKIDGQLRLVIAENSGSVTIFCDGSNYFVAGTR